MATEGALVVATPPRPRRTAARGDRLFYAAMSAAIVLTVFVGFARTYYLRSYFFATPLPFILRLHGFVFTGWMLLFVAQTALVAQRRVDVHRRLGIVGAVWALVLTAVGAATAIAAGRRGYAAGSEAALTFLPIPLGDMLVFLGLVAAGIWHRRRSDVHKRLLLLATLSILDAAIARWPLAFMTTGAAAFFGITDLFVAAAAGYDLLTRRRVHPVYIWGGLAIVGSQLLRVAIARTETWLAVARVLLK